MGVLNQLGPVDWRQFFPEATADGITRAEEHADDEWTLFALMALRRAVRQKPEITVDDAAAVMAGIPNPPTTHEQRAMGPVMLRGAKLGWIEQTERFANCKRDNQHCCPKRIWRSLKYEGN